MDGMLISDALMIAVVTGISAGGTAWGATTVQMKWLRRDVNRAQNTADGAHSRIDRILGWPGGKRGYDPTDMDSN